MLQATWYFDFISPFAYLQSRRLAEIEQHYAVTPVPVLFAGLLKHHGHLGPAEIPAKRRFTYQQIVWRAQQMGLAIQFPAGHPFNPLPLLRMCIARGSDAQVLHRLFAFVWRDGLTPDDSSQFEDLCAELALKPDDIRTDQVKQALISNTDEAIKRGVFGVPTLTTQNQLFWGEDATDMAIAYAQGNAVFQAPEMMRVSELPELTPRPR